MKEDMDKILNGKAGKEFNKDLMNFHKHVDIIFVDFNQINN
jgi:hypothetical protein